VRRFLWILIAVFAIGVCAWWGTARNRGRQPHRLILAAAAESEWSGFTELQRQGLLTLIKDCLETDGAFTIGMVETLGAQPQGTLILNIAAHRNGMELDLRPQWTGRDKASLPKRIGPPQEVLASFCQDLEVVPRSIDHLIPKGSGPFWDLLEASGWGGDRDLDHCMRVGKKLIDQHPELASAWCAYAQQSFRKLSIDAAIESQAQEETEKGFLRALELVPGFPRAAYQYANMKTDSARQREALDVLFSALDRRPHAAFLLSGIAYAARTSGLLEGAQRALKRREVLLGPMRFESGLTENTYLYCGNFEAFSQTLGEDDDAPWRSMRDFYRGYIRLIRGQQAASMTFFRRCYDKGGSSIQFEQLAMVYDLQLNGRQNEAKARLDALCTDRAKLREPDGEFTFKLAEAYAFLGDIDDAEDMAMRAFSQGFSCARWYRESPLLKPLQTLPRYRALLQHIDDRQAVLASRYPTQRFG
jgi:hypothetical protein